MEDPVYLEDELVLKRMLKSETYQEVNDYFKTRLQCDFNQNHRRELVSWMRDVCQAEECEPDILPLSIRILDRFLSFVRTKRSQLQLLGSVALLLASKLRQTIQIPAQHLIFYTRELISLSELCEWELLVLTTLKWDLALITPVDYLDILIKQLGVDSRDLADAIRETSLRLIDDCCLDFNYSILQPSDVAHNCLLRSMDHHRLAINVRSMSDLLISNFHLASGSPSCGSEPYARRYRTRCSARPAEPTPRMCIAKVYKFNSFESFITESQEDEENEENNFIILSTNETLDSNLT